MKISKTQSNLLEFMRLYGTPLEVTKHRGMTYMGFQHDDGSKKHKIEGLSWYEFSGRVKTATIQALVESGLVKQTSSNRVWEWKRRRDGSSDRVPVWELVYEIC